MTSSIARLSVRPFFRLLRYFVTWIRNECKTCKHVRSSVLVNPHVSLLRDFIYVMLGCQDSSGFDLASFCKLSVKWDLVFITRDKNLECYKSRVCFGEVPASTQGRGNNCCDSFCRFPVVSSPTMYEIWDFLADEGAGVTPRRPIGKGA